MIILQPFLGFTTRIDMIINVVIGLMIIVLAYNIFPVGTIDLSSSNDTNQNKDSIDPSRKDDMPFVEHKSS